MNRESFYLEIGNIDDDLILEASKAHGHKKREINILRLACLATAACLCLICTALFFGLQKDDIYFNEANAPMASKVIVPADENTTIITLTCQELLDYYGLEQFPDTLSNLNRLEETQYFIYQDSENTIYDTNILQYKSADGAQTLSVLIAKEAPGYGTLGENTKQSRIDGVSLMLAKSEELTEYQEQHIYWAEINNQEVYLRIVSHGMDESSFITIIRELIKSQK